MRPTPTTPSRSTRPASSPMSRRSSKPASDNFQASTPIRPPSPFAKSKPPEPTVKVAPPKPSAELNRLVAGLNFKRIEIPPDIETPDEGLADGGKQPELPRRPSGCKDSIRPSSSLSASVDGKERGEPQLRPSPALSASMGGREKESDSRLRARPAESDDPLQASDRAVSMNGSLLRPSPSLDTLRSQELSASLTESKHHSDDDDLPRSWAASIHTKADEPRGQTEADETAEFERLEAELGLSPKKMDTSTLRLAGFGGASPASSISASASTSTCDAKNPTPTPAHTDTPSSTRSTSTPVLRRVANSALPRSAPIPPVTKPATPPSAAAPPPRTSALSSSSKMARPSSRPDPPMFRSLSATERLSTSPSSKPAPRPERVVSSPALRRVVHKDPAAHVRGSPMPKVARGSGAATSPPGASASPPTSKPRTSGGSGRSPESPDSGVVVLSPPSKMQASPPYPGKRHNSPGRWVSSGGEEVAYLDYISGLVAEIERTEDRNEQKNRLVSEVLPSVARVSKTMRFTEEDRKSLHALLRSIATNVGVPLEEVTDDECWLVKRGSIFDSSDTSFSLEQSRDKPQAPTRSASRRESRSPNPGEPGVSIKTLEAKLESQDKHIFRQEQSVRRLKEENKELTRKIKEICRDRSRSPGVHATSTTPGRQGSPSLAATTGRLNSMLGRSSNGSGSSTSLVRGRSPTSGPHRSLAHSAGPSSRPRAALRSGSAVPSPIPSNPSPRANNTIVASRIVTPGSGTYMGCSVPGDMGYRATRTR